MAQLIPKDIFKIQGGRMFKVNGIGWDGTQDCLWVHEVKEVKHGESLFYEQIDSIFSKPKKEIQELFNQNKITKIN